MKSGRKLLGVIFDMDGVLCDSEPFICEAARRMFSETYGLNVREEDSCRRPSTRPWPKAAHAH